MYIFGYNQRKETHYRVLLQKSFKKLSGHEGDDKYELTFKLILSFGYPWYLGFQHRLEKLIIILIQLFEVAPINIFNCCGNVGTSKYFQYQNFILCQLNSIFIIFIL